MDFKLFQRATEKEYGFFEYHPSKAVAILATVLFGITTAVSLFQYVKYRSWVWLAFILAVLCELFGFALRIKSIEDPSNQPIYAAQYALVFLAPVLMAGNIYVIFGRLVYLVTPPQSRNFKTLWFPPRWVMPIFVGFDVISIFLQMIGAIALTTTEATDKDAASKMSRGKNIALAGVIVQLVAFGFFTFIAIRFVSLIKGFGRFYEWRISRENAPAKKGYLRNTSILIRTSWMNLMYALAFSCVLILARSIYRLVEFAAEDSSLGDKINGNEWVMYIFDALPMWFVVVAFNIFHPGMYLPYLGLKLPNSEKFASDTTDTDTHQLGDV